MIKKLVPILALLCAFNLASAEIKIATVSMAQLFDGYHKSEESNARLASIREELGQEEQQKQQQLQEREEAIIAMQEELENPMLSDEAKKAKQQEIQAAIREGQQLLQQFQQWQREKRNELMQRQAQIRQGIIDEIREVVNYVAGQEDADLVLDTSDVTGSGVPTVLFANRSLDLTNKVLAELNKDQGAAE